MRTGAVELQSDTKATEAYYKKEFAHGTYWNLTSLKALKEWEYSVFVMLKSSEEEDDDDDSINPRFNR